MKTLNSLKILPKSFYERDTRKVAIELLGKFIYRKISKKITLIVKIVEVEAYLGEIDPACHAYIGYTPRTSAFYQDPGHSYVYISYGIHYCLNTISYNQQFRGGILIRAGEPISGIEKMKKNRKKKSLHELTNGPGKLCQALEITTEDNKKPLFKGELTIRDHNSVQSQNVIIGVSSRIGISKAIDWDLRYFIFGNSYVSGLKNQNYTLFNPRISLTDINSYVNNGKR